MGLLACKTPMIGVMSYGVKWSLRNQTVNFKAYESFK